ncbi:MAG: DUF2878 family protein [Gammaproteobacteria bacterium]|nr:DUF2878 family protein [Gammaproteobacteria bacterium]
MPANTSKPLPPPSLNLEGLDQQGQAAFSWFGLSIRYARDIKVTKLSRKGSHILHGAILNQSTTTTRTTVVSLCATIDFCIDSTLALLDLLQFPHDNGLIIPVCLMLLWALFGGSLLYSLAFLICKPHRILRTRNHLGSTFTLFI